MKCEEVGKHENLGQLDSVSETGSKFLDGMTLWFNFLTHLSTIKLWGFQTIVWGFQNNGNDHRCFGSHPYSDIIFLIRLRVSLSMQ